MVLFLKVSVYMITRYQTGLRRVLAGNKFTISQKASQMLVEFLGTDLGKINNELSKLQLVIPQGTEITASSY